MVRKDKNTRLRFIPNRDIELAALKELQLNKPNAILAGVDEVGRGSLAGPVSVGIVLINAATGDDFPQQLRDSKQISARIRESLAAPCREWGLASAVGSASANQINQHGIIQGLQLAAADAIAQLSSQGYKIDGVLLDGSHNWWSNPGLFNHGTQLPEVPVKTVVKGDAQCAVVAAASVIAKVCRDHYMEEIAEQYPQYDWVHNKGYSSAKHIAALSKYGVSEYHRTSWKLPGINSGV
ncbi:ribonuclease HII [Arcanobacterium hippocoleae]